MDPKLVHQPKLKPSIFVADNTHHLASWATLSWINHGSGSMDHASSNEHGRCQHIVEQYYKLMPLAGCGSGVCTTVSSCSDIKDVETADTGLMGARAAVKFGLWPTPGRPGKRDAGRGSAPAAPPRPCPGVRRGRCRCACASPDQLTSSALRLADTPPRRPRKGRRPSAHSRVESFQRPESHDR